MKALRDEENEDDLDDYGKLEDSKQVIQAFDSFGEKMSKITDIDQIKEIVINEYYTGWGEFARDGISDFLRSVLPVKIRDYSDWYGACLYDKDDKDMKRWERSRSISQRFSMKVL